MFALFMFAHRLALYMYVFISGTYLQIINKYVPTGVLDDD